MDAGSVRSNAHRRRTSCPKDRPLGRYFPRRPGIIYRGVYACARVCVCRPRSLRIPEFSVFEKSTETTVTALVIRDSQETRNTCSPLFPLSRGRVLASRGRFSCPGVSRCTAKINSPCASELHLFVFLGCYLNVRACVYE